MRRNLQEAIWFGHSCVANQFGADTVRGQWRTVVKRWEPRHGDKPRLPLRRRLAAVRPQPSRQHRDRDNSAPRIEADQASRSFAIRATERDRTRPNATVRDRTGSVFAPGLQALGHRSDPHAVPAASGV